MKIELTLAEVKAILLNHVNQLTGQDFNAVESVGYRGLPDAVVISKEDSDVDD